MRLVSFQERVLHHVDRGGALCRLGGLVLKLVPHEPQPVLQPPVVGPQGLHEGVEGVVLIPVPIALGAQSSEVVIPLPSSTLQLLSPAVKSAEKDEIRKRVNIQGMGSRPQT
jgi:hypothetical protein